MQARSWPSDCLPRHSAPVFFQHLPGGHMAMATPLWPLRWAKHTAHFLNVNQVRIKTSQPAVSCRRWSRSCAARETGQREAGALGEDCLVDMLTPEQQEKWREEGYLVFEGFASPEEVAALKQRGEELVDSFAPKSVSVFSTRNQTAKTDKYFLDSASNISFFFEEKAFDEAGQLTKPINRAINKVGHALHDLDPVFRRWSRSERVAELMAELGFARPLPAQSMLICKQPFVGGEVVPHQDSSFLTTAPQLSCVGIWLALEDATRDNGCLWTLPGSHKAGCHRRFLRAPDGSVSFDGDMPSFDEASFVPVEVKAGTLVVLHGCNVHLSKENTSPHSRHAYAMHFIEGAPGYTWLPTNWLQRRPDLPFEPLYDKSSGGEGQQEAAPAPAIAAH